MQSMVPLPLQSLSWLFNLLFHVMTTWLLINISMFTTPGTQMRFAVQKLNSRKVLSAVLWAKEQFSKVHREIFGEYSSRANLEFLFCVWLARFFLEEGKVRYQVSILRFLSTSRQAPARTQRYSKLIVIYQKNKFHIFLHLSFLSSSIVQTETDPLLTLRPTFRPSVSLEWGARGSSRRNKIQQGKVFFFFFPRPISNQPHFAIRSSFHNLHIIKILISSESETGSSRKRRRKKGKRWRLLSATAVVSSNFLKFFFSTHHRCRCWSRGANGEGRRGKFIMSLCTLSLSISCN